MKLVTVFVHGTFSNAAIWLPKNSAFADELVRGLGCRAVRFSWSGINDHVARLSAGRRLARMLHLILRSRPESEFLLVGHSHGGTVIQYALRDSSIERQVLGTVFLGTPFLNFRGRDLDFGIRVLLLGLFLAFNFLLFELWHYSLEPLFLGGWRRLEEPALNITGIVCAFLLVLGFRKWSPQVSLKRYLARTARDWVQLFSLPRITNPTFVASTSRDEAKLAISTFSSIPGLVELGQRWAFKALTVTILASWLLTAISVILNPADDRGSLFSYRLGEVGGMLALLSWGLGTLLLLAMVATFFFGGTLPTNVGTYGFTHPLVALTVRCWVSNVPSGARGRVFLRDCSTLWPREEEWQLRHSLFHTSAQLGKEVVDWIHLRMPGNTHLEPNDKKPSDKKPSKVITRENVLVVLFTLLIVVALGFLVADEQGELPYKDKTQRREKINSFPTMHLAARTSLNLAARASAFRNSVGCVLEFDKQTNKADPQYGYDYYAWEGQVRIFLSPELKPWWHPRSLVESYVYAFTTHTGLGPILREPEPKHDGDIFFAEVQNRLYYDVDLPRFDAFLRCPTQVER